MPHALPTRSLPAQPSLDQLRRQARELREAFRAGDTAARTEVAAFYHGAEPGTFALHEAQLVLARSYGYDSWPKLRARVDGLTVDRLIAAVRANDLHAVRAMLTIRPEIVDMTGGPEGYAPLHHAVQDRRPEIVRELMRHGANPHQGLYPFRDGTTPLTVASDRGDADLVAIIQEEKGRRRAGAPAVETARQASPLARAVLEGDHGQLRAAHARGELSPPGNDEGWLLRTAVDANRPDTLALLLDLGLDPDARVRVEGLEEVVFTWGMPLYACVRQGHHEMAALLLARGADPNAQVYASGTPLSEAYGQRDERMIALLEQYGGASNPSMAGLYRRKDLAQRLLDRHGDTPLADDGFGSGPVAEQLVNAAARGGDPEILQMGLARIAWPAGDQRWYGPLAATLGFWNHWIGPWCHLEWDRTGYLTCLERLLERCGPPVARGRAGTTLLHGIAAMGEHVYPEERVAFATAALNAGAPLDTRDDLLKSTPLGWACRLGHEQLVRLFLERGADPDEAANEPWARPIAWAERRGHAEIADLLRSRLTR